MTNVVILMTNILAHSMIEWSDNLTNWYPYVYTYVGATSCQLVIKLDRPVQYWRWRSNTLTNPPIKVTQQPSNDTINWDFIPLPK
jgi:hypothetical protein